MMNKEVLKEYTLIEHIKELRSRIIKSMIFFIFAFIFCYCFKREIYNIITYPLLKTLTESKLSTTIIYTKITEAFTSTLSLTFSSAFFLSIPYIGIQLWLYIMPGLYKKERKLFLPYLLITPILFITGVIFCYFLILPIAYKFLISFGNNNAQIPLILQTKITEYIDLTITLLKAFGISFLFPIFLILLIKFNIVSRQTLITKRKYAIIIIFIISAILTPPDVISQILLAIPLLLMYETSIYLTRHNK